MTEAKYGRSGNKVETVDTGEVKVFPSVSAAKKFSTKIQMETDGALGRGSVRIG